jgi:hypothetical protein
MSDMTTWRELIEEAMELHHESFFDVVNMCAETNGHYVEKNQTFSGVTHDTWLDFLFNSGYGGANGAFFTVWTENRVYFPVGYDGAEWVTSVPRNPNGEATRHVGGG